MANPAPDPTLTSADYMAGKFLESGDVEGKWMGFTWIPSERTPLSGGVRLLYAWAKSGVTLGKGADITTKVGEDPGKGFNVRIYAKMSIGSVRVEEEKVVEIAVSAAQNHRNNPEPINPFDLGTCGQRLIRLKQMRSDRYPYRLRGMKQGHLLRGWWLHAVHRDCCGKLLGTQVQTRTRASQRRYTCSFTPLNLFEKGLLDSSPSWFGPRPTKSTNLAKCPCCCTQHEPTGACLHLGMISSVTPF